MGKANFSYRIVFSDIMFAHWIISCRHGKAGGRELLHVLLIPH